MLLQMLHEANFSARFEKLQIKMHYYWLKVRTAIEDLDQTFRSERPLTGTAFQCQIGK